MKRLSLLIASIAFATSVSADTVSFSFGIPVTTTTTEINQTGWLALFDSGLGTLTGAQLTVYSEATLSLSGTNKSDQPQNASLTSDTTLFFSSSLAPLSSFLAPPITLSLTSGSQSYAPSETSFSDPSPKRTPRLMT